jgi:mannose-6-phosphate isomerase-like protein (cupin superfamily)
LDIVNRNRVAAFVTKDSSTIRELMAPRNSEIERQSLAEAQILVGGETQAHYHPNTEEIYYITAGQGLMALESEIREVGVGDSIAIVAGKKHQIRNTGTETLTLLCCCVPAYQDSDTIMCEALLGR